MWVFVLTCNIKTKTNTRKLSYIYLKTDVCSTGVDATRKLSQMNLNDGETDDCCTRVIQ